MLQSFLLQPKQAKVSKIHVNKNQDQYIIQPVFNGMRDVHLFGVCDGHGVNGKLVSGFIK